MNPLEQAHIWGIGNYIDLGFILSTAPDKPSSVGIAGSWQFNKNWMVKTRLASSPSGTLCDMSLIMKKWTHPTVTFSLTVSLGRDSEIDTEVSGSPATPRENPQNIHREHSNSAKESRGLTRPVKNSTLSSFKPRVGIAMEICSLPSPPQFEVGPTNTKEGSSYVVMRQVPNQQQRLVWRGSQKKSEKGIYEKIIRE